MAAKRNRTVVLLIAGMLGLGLGLQIQGCSREAKHTNDNLSSAQKTDYNNEGLRSAEEAEYTIADLRSVFEDEGFTLINAGDIGSFAQETGASSGGVFLVRRDGTGEASVGALVFDLAQESGRKAMEQEKKRAKNLLQEAIAEGAEEKGRIDFFARGNMLLYLELNHGDLDGIRRILEDM